MVRSISFKGSPLTLIGRNLESGMRAPGFRIIGGELNPVGLADFEDKIKVITTFPSLDTPVCDLQLKEFNKRAVILSDTVVVIAISNDLPFAQKRFCSENSIDRVLVFSDYSHASFGINYGLLIKELNLLARSILILDKNNVIRYISVVDELSQQPFYDEAIDKLDEVIHRPSVESAEAITMCNACDGSVAAFNADEIKKQGAHIHSDWNIIDNAKITRSVKTDDYESARDIIRMVSLVSDEKGHHPVLELAWNAVQITFSTHAVKGLSSNDFSMARIVDQILAS
jgi:thioredoxin-dependent peroxiredoxin